MPKKASSSTSDIKYSYVVTNEKGEVKNLVWDKKTTEIVEKTIKKILPTLSNQYKFVGIKTYKDHIVISVHILKEDFNVVKNLLYEHFNYLNPKGLRFRFLRDEESDEEPEIDRNIDVVVTYHVTINFGVKSVKNKGKSVYLKELSNSDETNISKFVNKKNFDLIDVNTDEGTILLEGDIEGSVERNSVSDLINSLVLSLTNKPIKSGKKNLYLY